MQRCMGCMREFDDAYTHCPHCGYAVGSPAESINHLPPGTLLLGRYTIGKALGQGGFGVTYIAWDNRLRRPLAVKEYMPGAYATRIPGRTDVVCYNTQAQTDFDKGLQKTLQETSALAQMGDLEGVVKVHDCVEANKTAYILMELLRGETVNEMQKKRGRFSFAQTLEIMTPVLRTLDAMHKQHMIHRDVAPDNIFVCDNGRVKLLDFGTARVVGEDQKTLSVVLKRGFAPPEQYIAQNRQGSFTDVYASSATMYRMLTGKTPPDALERVDSDTLRSIRELAPDVPTAAEAAILRGMAVRSEQRTQTASQLLLELQSVSAEPLPDTKPVPVKPQPEPKPQPADTQKTEPAGLSERDVKTEPVQPEPVTKQPAPQPQPVQKPQPVSKQSAPKKKRGKKALLLAAVAAVLVTAIVLGIVFGTGRTKPQATNTTETENTTETDSASAPASVFDGASVGDVIRFGTYEQDDDTANGKEAVEWLVLDKQDGKALVISKYALDAKPYNTEHEDVTWETCTLRTWLNGTFLNSAFSEEEQTRILTTTVTADANPERDTDPGRNTQDKVFLLSITEANKYFASDSARQCAPTAYAVAHGADTRGFTTSEEKTACWWRLRSPGHDQDLAAYVISDGSVSDYGLYVGYDDCAVRPAFWINLES